MHKIDELLLDDEHVVLKSQKHWMVFSYSVIWAIVGIYIFWREPQWQVFGIAALGIAVFMWFWGIITLLTTRLYLTELRFILQKGFIKPIEAQIRYEDIDKIECHQGTFRRFLGYGSIHLFHKQGTEGRFPHIRDPQTFCNQLQNQLDLLQTTSIE